MVWNGSCLCVQFMVPSPSFIRLLLATLVCSGFCGLNWTQLSATPVEKNDGQLIRQTVYEKNLVYAVSSESSSSVAEPCLAELPPFIFGLKPLTLAAPVFSVERQLGSIPPESQSFLSDCMRNKDPPGLR